MDAYQTIRNFPFSVICQALGLDVTRYKTRKQGEHFGACPVHGPKTNTTSFSYAPDGRFFCFSCQAKGKGALDLYMKVRQVGFQQAVEALKSFEGYKVPEPQKNPATGQELSGEGVLKPLEKDTWRKFAVPCPWLDARVPDKAIQELYGVFCYNNPARKSAYSGRVMIPVKDVEGRLFGYLGRLVSSSVPAGQSQEPPRTSQSPELPKYLFPPNLPKNRFLFGAHELRQHLAALGTGQSVYRHVYLVESPFSVMKFASLGFPAVSPFGWSVSSEQIDILCTLTRGLVFLPDKNKYHDAGNQLSQLASRLWLRFPPLPENCQDPEELDREQILALTR